jgi:hypothetical protein
MKKLEQKMKNYWKDESVHEQNMHAKHEDHCGV